MKKTAAERRAIGSLMAPSLDDLVLPGYRRDPWYGTTALVSLPYPTDPAAKQALLASSIGPQMIDWAEGRTDEPGLTDYQTGQPWRYTPGQKRFLILWYAYTPAGRWRYRRGAKRGAKGTGKDPFGGALCDGELIGPSHLVQDALGRWVGERHSMPLVQIASNSEAQSKDVLRVANALLNKEARAYYGVDCGETRTIVKGTGGRLEVLTASEASAEGDPATFIFLNEALALDTEIPTPDGWARMGDLRAGDYVLAPDGRPARVIKATEAYEGRACYRVTFGDRDSIVADAGHLWEVRDARRPDRGVRVLTTEQLLPIPGVRVYPRWQVRVTEPVDLPDASLPVDPYLLGAWLGDGTRNQVCITTSIDDADWWIEESARLGWPMRFRRDTPTGRELTFAVDAKCAGRNGTGFRAALARAGVLADKHVPVAYLRASMTQRMALLQGLMDTDGCIDGNGRAIFVNTNARIADAVEELARSLGHVVHRSVAQDHRKDSYLPAHRVEWQGRSDRPSVRMPRKVARLRTATARSDWQRIDAILPTESVPVRCIAVDSPDHLFLANGFKPTHNTHHMTESSGGHRVAKVSRRNVGKSPAHLQARMVDGTNAHAQGQDSVAERTYSAWRAQVEGKTSRVDILYDSIEAPPDTNLFDDASRRAGLRAAYADAAWADLERLDGEVLDPETTVADSIRYYLNGLAAAEDAWIDPRKFDALARPDVIVPQGDQIAMFLDCSKSGDATGLVASRLSDGHVITLGKWERPRGKAGEGWLAPLEEVDGAVRYAFEYYRVVWFGVDPSPAKDDDTEALYWLPLCDAWHRDFHRKLKVWATGGVKTGHSVLFDMRIKTLGGGARNAQFTQAAMQTAQDIDEHGTLTWDGDVRLQTHTHQAKRRTNPWGVSLGKVTRDSDKHVDLAVCMVGARMGRRIVLNSGKVKRRTGATSGRAVF